MKLEYMAPPEVDQRTEAKKRINKRTATWLSRLRGEVVVIIPSSDYNNPTFNWVWIASASSDGAYISKTEQTLDQIAETIVNGEWKFQPNAKIILEDKTC